MGAGGLFACLASLAVSAGAFLYVLRVERAKPAAVWVWAGAGGSGAKVALPLGSTSVPFTPALIVTPRTLRMDMKLQNADSSLTTVSVGGGDRVSLTDAIGKGQTVTSVAVTAA